MVSQSDWLPMMIATGFAAIGPPNPARCRKEAADYRCRLCSGKMKRLGYPVSRFSRWGPEMAKRKILLVDEAIARVGAAAARRKTLEDTPRPAQKKPVRSAAMRLAAEVDRLQAE